jgi:hypothetical protein
MKAYRNWLIPFLIIASTVWSFYDWSHLHQVVARIHQLEPLVVILAISEICFITGAVIMAAEVAGALGESHGLWRHLRHHRRLLRETLGHNLQTKWFGLGFWLNFAGAVITSAVLAGGVIWLMPVASWGLFVLLIIDIIATFSWRVPLHRHRRRLRRSS